MGKWYRYRLKVWKPGYYEARMIGDEWLLAETRMIFSEVEPVVVMTEEEYELAIDSAYMRGYDTARDAYAKHTAD